MQKSPGAALDKQTVLRDIKQRDALDSKREVAPLKCPDNAYRIDTSFLSIEQIVDQIAAYVKAPQAKKGGAFYRFVLFIARCYVTLFYRHKEYGIQHFCPGSAIIAPNHAS